MNIQITRTHFFVKNFFLVAIYILSYSTIAAGDDNYTRFKFQGLRNYQPALVTFIVENDTSEEDSALPDKWDWRQVGEQNWLTPVTKQQPSCGDCTMHAMASVYESQYKITLGLHWFNPKLSIPEGFFCGGGQCSSGWSPESVLEYGRQVGFVDESCGAQITSFDSCNQKICADVETRRYKIERYEKVTSGALDINSIRKALLKGPVLTTMGIYDDFYRYSWGVYKKNTDTPSNIGHMLAIVGYDKHKKAWIVKNSWGDKWVDNGYGYIYEKDTSGFGLHSWSLTLPSTAKYIEIENVSDHKLINDSFYFKLKSNLSSDKNLFIRITKDSEVLWQKKCRAPECEIELDTRTLADSAYQIQAFSEADNLKSMIKTIRILNSSVSSLELQKNIHLASSKNSNKNIFELTFNNNYIPRMLEVRLLNKKEEIVYSQMTETLSTTVSIHMNPLFKIKKIYKMQIWIKYMDDSWLLAKEVDVIN